MVNPKNSVNIHYNLLCLKATGSHGKRYTEFFKEFNTEWSMTQRKLHATIILLVGLVAHTQRLRAS